MGWNSSSMVTPPTVTLRLITKASLVSQGVLSPLDQALEHLVGVLTGHGRRPRGYFCNLAQMGNRFFTETLPKEVDGLRRD